MAEKQNLPGNLPREHNQGSLGDNEDYKVGEVVEILRPFCTSPTDWVPAFSKVVVEDVAEDSVCVVAVVNGALMRLPLYRSEIRRCKIL